MLKKLHDCPINTDTTTQLLLPMANNAIKESSNKLSKAYKYARAEYGQQTKSITKQAIAPVESLYEKVSTTATQVQKHIIANNRETDTLTNTAYNILLGVISYLTNLKSL